jgi:hypothetical protein
MASTFSSPSNNQTLHIATEDDDVGDTKMPAVAISRRGGVHDGTKLRCSPRIIDQKMQKAIVCSNEKEMRSDKDDSNGDGKMPPVTIDWTVKTPQKNGAARDVTILRCSPRLNFGKTQKDACDPKEKVFVNNGKLQLYPGMEFDTFNELQNHVESYGLQNGFIVSNSHNYYKYESNEEQERVRQRFEPGSYCVTIGKDGKRMGPAYRGKFMCNKHGKCNWRVLYTHACLPERGNNKYKYLIKTNDFNLLHSQHEMHVSLIESCCSAIHVKSEKQLTTDEQKYLCDLAIYTNENIGKIRGSMQKKFQGRTYDTNLLTRVVKKDRDDYHGKGRDKINDLRKRGEWEKSRGGAYDEYIDDTFRLTSFILQTKEMRLYASMYNDFVILDGTHGTNKYGLIMEPPTLVDCFGRSVIAGIPICESEENEFSATILQTLGLVREGGVLMTDEGSAFFGLAEKLGMHQILCSFHFQNKTKCVVGLNRNFKKEFDSKFRDLIYRNYRTSEAFDEAYLSFESKVLQKYPNAADASRLLKSLYHARKKVCCTFTKHYFTCGHTSTGRGEGTNSSIKGRGDLKREMKGYGLFELVEHVIAIFERRQAAAMQEIIKFIQRDDKTIECSNYVHSQWSSNIKLSPNYPDAELDKEESQNGMEVWNVTSTDNEISTVTIHSNGKYPSCTCGIFCSTQIPCPCICVVLQRKGKRYFLSSDLHPRWQVENHPLWKVAHYNLRISLPEEQSNDTMVDDNIDAIPPANMSQNSVTDGIFVSKKEFDKIKIPKAPKARYCKLKKVFDEISKYAENCPATYRHFFAVLLKESAHCRERCSGDASAKWRKYRQLV